MAKRRQAPFQSIPPKNSDVWVSCVCAASLIEHLDAMLSKLSVYIASAARSVVGVTSPLTW